MTKEQNTFADPNYEGWRDQDTQKIITEIKSYILDATDGPITRFVIIYRSLQLVAKGDYYYIYVANALDEILIDFEPISSNEFPHSL